MAVMADMALTAVLSTMSRGAGHGLVCGSRGSYRAFVCRRHDASRGLVRRCDRGSGRILVHYDRAAKAAASSAAAAALVVALSTKAVAPTAAFSVVAD